MSVTVEICCGSYYDACQAAKAGAERIELNSALFMGGLTPSLASLLLTKQETKLKVIAMDRPRGAGFCYGTEDFKVMLSDCQMMMEHGADGIAFGCLKEDLTVDEEQTEKMVKLIKAQSGEAVFHRAFDCVKNPHEAVKQLINLGVDRVLTSGQKPKATEGWELIRDIQEKYSGRIEILAGSGINSSNAADLVYKTGISQIHSSCKDWASDPTTASGQVSYSYAQKPYDMHYEAVSEFLVKELLNSVP